jgi:hypothetical protein
MICGSTTNDLRAIDLLREILAKTAAGPSECLGADMRDGLTWKASFTRSWWKRVKWLASVGSGLLSRRWLAPLCRHFRGQIGDRFLVRLGLFHHLRNLLIPLDDQGLDLGQAVLDINL